MTKEEYIAIMDHKIKLLRNEKNYTQDKMAELIGLSKKTLVQVEKGRASLGWSTAVCTALLFKDSEILHLSFGGDPQDLIRSIAFENYDGHYPTTMGGKLWWKTILSNEEYIIQQNIISQHYRILDSQNRRICFTFDYEYIVHRFNELGGAS